MSDTTYVHEVSQRPGVRVTLTLDAAEARALADVAASAIDGALLAQDDTVLGNAQNIYEWSTKAANMLEFSANMPGSARGEE